MTKYAQETTPPANHACTLKTGTGQPKQINFKTRTPELAAEAAARADDIFNVNPLLEQILYQKKAAGLYSKKCWDGSGVETALLRTI